MTLPTGSLSMSQIATELGLSLPLSLQHAWVRALAQVGGAACDFNSLRGKTGRFDGIITTFQTGSGGSTAYHAALNPAPFFGAVLGNINEALIGGSISVTIASGTPSFTGNIVVKNNTLGHAQILSWNGSFWSGTDSSGGIVPGVSTYSFTILPST